MIVVRMKIKHMRKYRSKLEIIGFVLNLGKSKKLKSMRKKRNLKYPLWSRRKIKLLIRRMIRNHTLYADSHTAEMRS